jgi:hypothetical protein
VLRRALYFVFSLFYQLAAVGTVIAKPAQTFEFLDSLHPVSAVHSKPILFRAPGNAGEWSFFGAASISNTMNVRDDFYIVDAESRRLDLAAQYAATDAINVGFQLPLNWRGSGFTDDLIEGFHDTFGLSNGPRDRIPDKDYNIGGKNPDYTQFSVPSQGTGLGNPQLLISYDRFETVQPFAAASLPGIDSDYAHTGVDWSVGVKSCIDLNWIELTGFFVYEWIYADSFSGMALPSGSFATGLTGNIPVVDKISVFLGYFWNQSLLRRLEEANSFETYLDGGIVYRSDRGTIYQFTVRENPGPQTNSVDVSGILSIKVGSE